MYGSDAHLFLQTTDDSGYDSRNSFEQDVGLASSCIGDFSYNGQDRPQFTSDPGWNTNINDHQNHTLNTVNGRRDAVLSSPVEAALSVQPGKKGPGSFFSEPQDTIFGYYSALPAPDYTPGTASQMQPTPQHQHCGLLLTSMYSEDTKPQISSTSPQKVNPIVCVESCSRDASPSRSCLSRSGSRRGQAHGSTVHLSPYLPDCSSDYDTEDQGSLNAYQCAPTEYSMEVQRSIDGVWLPSPATGQAGINPESREKMKDIYVSSLNDLENERYKEVKKAHVQEWLTASGLDNDADYVARTADQTYLGQSFNRPRAKSTGDAPTSRIDCMSLDISNHTMIPEMLNIHDTVITSSKGSTSDETAGVEQLEDDKQPNSQAANTAIASKEKEHGPSHFPSREETPYSDVSCRAASWTDPHSGFQQYNACGQAPSSNDAIIRFYQRARDIETASLAATLGSRRLSESDIGSLYAASGVMSIASSGIEKAGREEKRDRKGSFFNNILPKCSSSNVLKRKNNDDSNQDQQQQQGSDSHARPLQRNPSNRTISKRIGSWVRSKSPALNTKVSNGILDSTPKSALTPSVSTSTWVQARNVIRRSRSRSDVGKTSGLSGLMSQHGGPPMLALPTSAPIEQPAPSEKPLDVDEDDVEDTESMEDSVSVDLSIRCDPVDPSEEGFRQQIRDLNPHLANYIVERMTLEQTRRYRRLLDLKVQHASRMDNHISSTDNRCDALKPASSRPGNQASISFLIVKPGSSREALQDGTMTFAQFPSGIPLPPVKSLPAEFECPFCFKAKRFAKPSDWTKHVHEDVQPFTCTFSSCEEAKSFKRKADWVRHENERHRQLESWKCDVGECSHVCYRKDNFVQHLVREHKMPETKIRTVRAASRGSKSLRIMPHQPQDTGEPCVSTGADGTEEVWARVDKCRQEVTKHAKNEPCKFCGSVFESWKKLTVHVAKHMEQISLPVLRLVEAAPTNAQSSANIVDLAQYPPVPSISPLLPPTSQLTVLDNDLPLYNHNAVVDFFDSNNGLVIPSLPNGTAMSASYSQVGHTYPPLQTLSYREQSQALSANYDIPAERHLGHAGRSMPSFTMSQGQYASAETNSQMNNAAYPLAEMVYTQQPVFSSPVDGSPFGSGGFAPGYFEPSGYAS